jgi:hypothetical protein
LAATPVDTMCIRLLSERYTERFAHSHYTAALRNWR